MPVLDLPIELVSPARLLVLDGVCVIADGVTILDVARLSIVAGTHLGVAGVSGSGKTTLLHVMAGLRQPTAGRVLWGATDISTLPPGQGDAWRRSNVGLVFQDFQLIPELNALENVLLPSGFGGTPPGGLSPRAAELLAAMGVVRTGLRVAKLARGEQQRVAIARACLHRPSLILADEPTASLDADNAAAVVDLLVKAARDVGATLVVVSHDPNVLAQLDRTVALQHGCLDPEPQHPGSQP
jgi:putative ABC transport system ATP-binding protein